MIAGSQPATAIDTILARGLRPSASAFSADIRTIAAAPSVNCEEVPAVTVPPLGLKAGRNLPSDSAVVSGRIVSSVSIKTLKPFSS